ncbi:hypothetical protein [Streptomyces sp. MA5143a]|nr:hypothetical protein [Streptomyces sp. MA5143a]SPF05976.1 hypothetical protein SMA5143A_6796 [Streptomyces sp. MA5143a]
MKNTGNTGNARIIRTLSALALIMALPLGATVAAGSGPSVALSVNGWQ